MSHLLYIICIIFFVGTALVLEVYPDHRSLKKYSRVILVASFIYLIGGLSDTVAHWWHIWGYGTRFTLHARIFGAEIETVIFSVGTGIAVTIAAIFWAEDVDSNQSFMHRFGAHSINKRQRKNQR